MIRVDDKELLEKVLNKIEKRCSKRKLTYDHIEFFTYKIRKLLQEHLKPGMVFNLDPFSKVMTTSEWRDKTKSTQAEIKYNNDNEFEILLIKRATLKRHKVFMLDCPGMFSVAVNNIVKEYY